MEIRVLQYFLAIAREQSIVRAAESLHLSQPTLSTQIKGMEEELGKQLLIRGTKGIYFTRRSLGAAIDPVTAGVKRRRAGSMDPAQSFRTGHCRYL